MNNQLNFLPSLQKTIDLALKTLGIDESTLIETIRLRYGTSIKNLSCPTAKEWTLISKLLLLHHDCILHPYSKENHIRVICQHLKEDRFPFEKNETVLKYLINYYDKKPSLFNTNPSCSYQNYDNLYCSPEKRKKHLRLVKNDQETISATKKRKPIPIPPTIIRPAKVNGISEEILFSPTLNSNNKDDDSDDVPLSNPSVRFEIEKVTNKGRNHSRTPSSKKPIKVDHVPEANFWKEARLRVNLSQAQVARKLGYKQTSGKQNISNWERGTQTPPPRILKQLLKIYKIEVDDYIELVLTAKRKELIHFLKNGKNGSS